VQRAAQMVPQSESGEGEPSWLAITSARTYHRAHRHFVEAFHAATGNCCVGPDGQIDPVAVWHWQEQHGLVADGRVGPETLAAAVRQSRRRL
jgi:murein L,D-transpeptidase YcbB/YkuD